MWTRNRRPDSRYTGWDADGGFAEFATGPGRGFPHSLDRGDQALADLANGRPRGAGVLTVEA
ncbi:hypothetical protein [Allorhizocola rhizosphaerae]|uniref:hypothetical protein n=1 Tax=Allorhizocola rhizosphaerae TaxID=1872709 RepID=UPI0013C2A704|nr:hypothetical protein [Allorhizocola rhizosphaerae]